MRGATVRAQVDLYPTHWLRLSEVVNMADAQEPSLPCICGCQRNRSNMSADAQEAYYKQTIYALSW